MSKLIWTNNETDKLVTTTENRPYEDEPICPQCGQLTTYEEGQIGQDFMGNDEYGYWYACHHCNISTQAWELEEYG